MPTERPPRYIPVSMIAVLALLAGMVYIGYSSVKPSEMVLSGDLPFEKKDRVLDPRDASLHEFLVRAVGNEYVVLSMVPLSKMVRVREGARAKMAYEKMSDQMRVQHVLCEPGTNRPVASIFVNGEEKEKVAGVSTEEALESAGIRVILVESMGSYPQDDASARALLSAIKRKMDVPQQGDPLRK